jgi:hypothetical protein
MCGGFVGDVVDNTLGSAGDFVENTAGSIGGSAGDFVENTAGSVLDYVGDQLQEIEDDPWKFAAKAAAVASGNAWALPIIEGVDTIEEGGTIGEGLLSAGKSYAGQQIGAELGGGEFATTGEDFNMGGFDTGSGFVGLDAATAAELGLTGESALGSSGASGDVLAGLSIEEGAPITDYSREVTLTPGGNAVPATTLPSEMATIDAEIEAAAKALPSTISPMKALQGLRGASGLLGGGQQQPQAVPQMQMGSRTQMPQGAVDYSGIYNLLALQRARNPNSLLG